MSFRLCRLRNAAAFLLGTLLVTTLNAADSTQQEAKLETNVRVEMRYLLGLPKNYDQKESWPLLLFLHGSGERGDNLDMVKVHGPPKLLAQGKELPFIVVSPQCPKGQSWEPFQLIALLDDLNAKYKVDRDRVYLTGLSMGGYGTWRLASYAPERFAAIVPICGGGETFWTSRFKHVPVWAFHGEKDNAVPVERTQKMIEKLRADGAEPKLTIYPDAEHDSWTRTYENPELYEWLLAQKRKSSP